MQIDNRLSFPKHPSESQLFLSIIEIIALNDKQYRPKNSDQIGGQTRSLLLLESSKYLHHEWECVIGYIKMIAFRICSQGKNSM